MDDIELIIHQRVQFCRKDLFPVVSYQYRSMNNQCKLVCVFHDFNNFYMDVVIRFIINYLDLSTSQVFYKILYAPYAY